MNAPGAVHLACAEVAALLQQAPAPAQWLTSGEQARLAQLVAPRRRDQFLAARWQARWLLAQVFGGVPQQWALEAPRDAPPRVQGRSDLVLSISHSGARTACALAADAVGLDLEQPQRRRDIAGLAALCCTPREQAMFEGLAQPQREALFYELWTVKEAWLKRRGEWIAPQRLVQLEAGLGDSGGIRAWTAPGWTLALAAASPETRWWSAQPRTVRNWELRDLTKA
jgi:4'-phosphopantetheinyl transferase